VCCALYVVLCCELQYVLCVVCCASKEILNIFLCSGDFGEFRFDGSCPRLADGVIPPEPEPKKTTSMRTRAAASGGIDTAGDAAVLDNNAENGKNATTKKDSDLNNIGGEGNGEDSRDRSPSAQPDNDHDSDESDLLPEGDDEEEEEEEEDIGTTDDDAEAAEIEKIMKEEEENEDDDDDDDDDDDEEDDEDGDEDVNRDVDVDDDDNNTDNIDKSHHHAKRHRTAKVEEAVNYPNPDSILMDSPLPPNDIKNDDNDVNNDSSVAAAPATIPTQLDSSLEHEVRLPSSPNTGSEDLFETPDLHGSGNN